ncbi:MAG: TetR/AcrR family transcriptional regulator [Lachnospiraceae bacterium]|nr:TetR/AcrR family transcriptional regulator [Lachnospiraceae bacterium]
MGIDMKEVIAEAAATLLFEKKVKKLTVKDIVEECHITRQAFYYHFEDIPELLNWVLEKDMGKLLKECQARENMESSLSFFLSAAVALRPYVQRSVQSNYGEEIGRLLNEFTYRFFEQTMEQAEMFKDYDLVERKLIMRYHCQAILGILRGWTQEDTQNIDKIAHQICLLIKGEIHPY